MDEEDDVFEIEKVLESSVTKGVKYYRVRWKGFGEDEDTWEPEENLFDCKDVLNEYWKEKKNAKQAKGTKRKTESTLQTSAGSKAKKKRKGRTTNNSTIARIDSTPSHDKKVLFTNEKTSARRTKTARKSASEKEFRADGKHKDTNQGKSPSKSQRSATRNKKRKKAIDDVSVFENNVDQVLQAKPLLDENQNTKDAGSFTLPREITPAKSCEDTATCISTSSKIESPNSLTSTETESPLQRENSPESLHDKTDPPLQRENSPESLHDKTDSPLQRENSPESLHGKTDSSLQRDNSCESLHAKTDSPLQRENSCESLHDKTDSPLQLENSPESLHSNTDPPLQRENARESSHDKTDSPLQRENSPESLHGNTDSPLQRENSPEGLHGETDPTLQRENSRESLHGDTDSPLQRENSRESLHGKTDSPLQRENSPESLHDKTDSPLQRENSRESLKIRRSWSSFEISPEYVPEYCDETLAYDICSEEEYEYFGDTGYLVKDSVGYVEGDCFEPTKGLAEDEGHVENESETKEVLSENEERTVEEVDELGSDKGDTVSENKTETVSAEEISAGEVDDELTSDNGHVGDEDTTKTSSVEKIGTKKSKQRKEEGSCETSTVSLLDTPTSTLEPGHSLSSSSRRGIGVKERASLPENDTRQLKKGDCDSTPTELLSKTEASEKCDVYSERNSASVSYTDEIGDVLKTGEKQDIRFVQSGKIEKIDRARYPRKDDSKLRTRLNSSDSVGLADNECMSPVFEPPKAFFDLVKKMDSGGTAETSTGEKESKGNELGEDSCKLGPEDTGPHEVCRDESCHGLEGQVDGKETIFEESESISNSVVRKPTSVPDKDRTDIMEKKNESDAQSVFIQVHGGENKQIDHPQIPVCDKLNFVDSPEVDMNSPRDVLDISQGKSRTDLDADVPKKISPRTSVCEIDNEKLSTISIEAGLADVVTSQSNKPDVCEVIVINDDIEKPSESSPRDNKKNRTKLRLSLKRKSVPGKSENSGGKSEQVPLVEKVGKEVLGLPEASNQKLDEDKLSEIRSDICVEKETNRKTGEKVNYLVESVIDIKQLNQVDLDDWSVDVDSDKNMETGSQEKLVEPVGVTQVLFRPESAPVCESYDSSVKRNDVSVQSKCMETVVKSVDRLEETVDGSFVEKLVGNTQGSSTLASDESTVNLMDSTDSSTGVGGRHVYRKKKQKRSKDLVGTKSKPIEICDDNSDEQEGNKQDERKNKQRSKTDGVQCENVEKEKIGKFLQKHSAEECETDLKDECFSSTGKTLATDREELPAVVPPKRTIESEADHISTAAKSVSQPALNTFERNLEKGKAHSITAKQLSASDTSKRKEPSSSQSVNDLDLKGQYTPPAEQTNDLLTKPSSSDLPKDEINSAETMKRNLTCSNGTSNIGHCSISAKKPSCSSIADQNIQCNAHPATSIIFPNIEKDKTNMASKQNVFTSDALSIEKQFSLLTKRQTSPVLKGKTLPATEVSRASLADHNLSQKQDIPAIVEATSSMAVERKSFPSDTEPSLAHPEVVPQTTPETLQNIIKKDMLPFPNEQLSSASTSGRKLKLGKVEPKPEKDTNTGSVAFSSMQKTKPVSSQQCLTVTPKDVTVTGSVAISSMQKTKPVSSQQCLTVTPKDLMVTGSVAISSMQKTKPDIVSSQQSLKTTPKDLAIAGSVAISSMQKNKPAVSSQQSLTVTRKDLTITGSVAISSMQKTKPDIVSSQQNLKTTPKDLTIAGSVAFSTMQKTKPISSQQSLTLTPKDLTVTGSVAISSMQKTKPDIVSSQQRLKTTPKDLTITGSVAISSMQKTEPDIVSSVQSLTTTQKDLLVDDRKNIHLEHVQTTAVSPVPVSLRQNLPSTTMAQDHQRYEQYKRGDDSSVWSGDTNKTYPYSTRSSFQPPVQSNLKNPNIAGASRQAFLTQQNFLFSSYFNQQSFLTQPGNPSADLARQKPFSAVAGLNWYPDNANPAQPRQFRFIAPQPFVQRPFMPALYPRHAQPVWYNMFAARLREMAQRAQPDSSTQPTGFNNKEYSSSIDADRAWYARHVGSTVSQSIETEPKAREIVKSQDGIMIRQSNNIQVSISESKDKDVFSSVIPEPYVGKNNVTDTIIVTESLSESKHGEPLVSSSSSLGESCVINEKDPSSKDNAKEGNAELSNVGRDTSVVDEKLKSGSRSLQQFGNHSPDTAKRKHPESTERDKSLSEKEILNETSEKDTVSKLSGDGSLDDSKKPSRDNGCHRADAGKLSQFKNKTKDRNEDQSTSNSEWYGKSTSRSSPDSKSESALKKTKKSNHKTNEKSEKSSERSGSRERSRDSPLKDREPKERRNDSEKNRGKYKEISRKKEDSSKTGSQAKADDRRSKRNSKKNIQEFKKQDSFDSELEFDLDDHSPGEVVSEKPEKADFTKLGIPTALPLREVKNAIKQGDSATVLASLAGGMSIDSQDSVTGMSLLTRAVSFGQENIVRLLLNHGANINIKDITGSTPLIEACEQGFESIVSLLLNAEIDINAKQTLSGETALIKACMKGHYSVVAMLLAHGADCQMRSVSGLTAAQLAVQCGHFEIRDLLESHNKKLQRCVETAIASCLCDSSKLMYPPMLPFVSLYPAEGQRFTYHFHCSDLLLSKTIVLFCLRAVFSRSGHVDLSFSKDNGVHTVLLNGSLQSPVLLNNKSVFVLEPKLETNRLILQTYQSHVHLLVCIYAAEMDENVLNIESGPT